MTRRSDAAIWQSATATGYAGGGYYNPVEEFVERARPLHSEKLSKLCGSLKMGLRDGSGETYLVNAIYEELSSLSTPRDILFALYHQGRYSFAVMIPNEERLMDFEVQVHDRTIRRLGFFSMNSSAAEEGLARDFIPPVDEHF